MASLKLPQALSPIQLETPITTAITPTTLSLSINTVRPVIALTSSRRHHHAHLHALRPSSDSIRYHHLRRHTLNFSGSGSTYTATFTPDANSTSDLSSPLPRVLSPIQLETPITTAITPTTHSHQHSDPSSPSTGDTTTLTFTRQTRHCSDLHSLLSPTAIDGVIEGHTTTLSHSIHALRTLFRFLRSRYHHLWRHTLQLLWIRLHLHRHLHS